MFNFQVKCDLSAKLKSIDDWAYIYYYIAISNCENILITYKGLNGD